MVIVPQSHERRTMMKKILAALMIAASVLSGAFPTTHPVSLKAASVDAPVPPTPAPRAPETHWSPFARRGGEDPTLPDPVETSPGITGQKARDQASEALQSRSSGAAQDAAPYGAIQSMRNPAAVYCTELGYEYRGHRGIGRRAAGSLPAPRPRAILQRLGLPRRTVRSGAYNACARERPRHGDETGQRTIPLPREAALCVDTLLAGT